MSHTTYVTFLQVTTKANANVATLGLPAGWEAFLEGLADDHHVASFIATMEIGDVALATNMIKTAMPAPAVVPPPPPPATVAPPPLPAQPVTATQARRIAAPVARPPAAPPPAPQVAAPQAPPPQPTAPAQPAPKPVAQAAPAAPANGVPPKPAAPGAPAPADPAGAPPTPGGPHKASTWKSMSRGFVIILVALIAITLIGTLVDAFAPPEVANQASDTINELSGIKLGFDWSGFKHALGNLTDNLNQPWVKRFFAAATVLLLLAMGDTISNFTGADASSVGGFLITILGIALIAFNPPLAVGLVGIGCALMRRDRDEGKQFWYAMIAVGFVLLAVSYIGRDWETWTTETTGKAIAKTLIGGYFNITETAGPILAYAIILGFYGSYFKDLTMDGTMKTGLLVTISVMIAGGFIPFFGTTMPLVVPGVVSLQWIGAIASWSLAMPMEIRETFARSIKAGKGATGPLLVLIGFLGIAYFLAKLGNDSHQWGLAVWYGIITLIISIILGIISGIQHQQFTEAGWRPWVSNMEQLLGDIITNGQFPWLFYPTVFNHGWLIFGLLALFGVVP